MTTNPVSCSYAPHDDGLSSTLIEARRPGRADRLSPNTLFGD